jgi:hypothetical protein
MKNFKNKRIIFRNIPIGNKKIKIQFIFWKIFLPSPYVVYTMLSSPQFPEREIIILVGF